jgi:hypothetical protein
VRATFLTLAVLAAGALSLAPAALADDGVSSNWAGYAVHGSGFHSVWASWRQPGVSCARGQTAYSAYWVGLGGYSSGSRALEQIGTEADCHDGRPVLSAWFEMVPAASVPVSLPVSPGDAISAVVTVSGHRATLTLSDLTRRRSFHTAVSSGSIDVTSAEWIVEAPSDCAATCSTLPLANFGSALFTGARAQLGDGYVGTIADRRWSTTRIRLSPSGRQFIANNGGSRAAGAAITSGLTWGGSVFAVSYTPVGTSGAGAYGMRRLFAGSARLVHPLRSGRRGALARP